ncbi:hypothetical protein M011DRAFT_199944 [Sporormia fimetaria CBS 119925]|uniref:Uncharacterized protein n=1 Tax=Sporormia fimetaria CBS 119925 TaxID=1340428 RepID=A0A6A6V2X6_9PLEO|nr:hypothetical protein M011DRAFT_199944 [Sporormia fimetaria CBS 119925]
MTGRSMSISFPRPTPILPISLPATQVSLTRGPQNGAAQPPVCPRVSNKEQRPKHQKKRKNQRMSSTHPSTAPQQLPAQPSLSQSNPDQSRSPEHNAAQHSTVTAKPSISIAILTLPFSKYTHIDLLSDHMLTQPPPQYPQTRLTPLANSLPAWSFRHSRIFFD